MPSPLTVTFLGTSAGSGPSHSRNTTSILLNLNGSMCLVDCAEGTQRQLLHSGQRVWGKIERIYVTHMHLDHVAGIAPFLSNMMSAIARPPGLNIDYTKPRIQFFSPPGLRLLLRTQLSLSQTMLDGTYAVHELLLPSEHPSAPCDPDDLHPSESPGLDLVADKDGVWHDIDTFAGINISSTRITHRVPCLGYYFSEAPQPSPIPQNYLAALDANAEALAEQGVKNPRALLRTITKDREPVTLPDGQVLSPPELAIDGRSMLILGDTSDASPCLRLLDQEKGVSLLVHECTNAYIPVEVDPYMGGDRTTADKMREKAISRGHSTPDMAGAFAKLCGARRLAMNHFGLRFQAPGKMPYITPMAQMRSRVIAELEDQASAAWGLGRAVCATDFMTIEIHTHELEPQSSPWDAKKSGGHLTLASSFPEETSSDTAL
ncbi:hypothetical protein CALCODRAFT_501130 [Calocera cornea HHB12733]|uniref:Metallo-beta-lactamase domain-containing protein n=1 Tax=Calocera cornea HHB12733 TaxID=1353952 RepID=A0A165DSH8_9BASI|nr:hypothetical protein CALCODRAFT_501130 [Calocera cornea HHB12733]